MPDTITICVNGVAVDVPAGTSVAVAVLRSGKSGFRRSVSGEARGPLCGMGICFECRVTIDGLSQSVSCQIECRPGMDVITA